LEVAFLLHLERFKQAMVVVELLVVVSLLVFDIGIMKLSPDGSQRIYATYIGGSGNEMPQSLIVDPQGQLVIAGRTDSPNYPTTGSTYTSAAGKV
jgi:hypothetical protein